MCTYSMVIDHYRDKWIPNNPYPSVPWQPDAWPQPYWPANPQPQPLPLPTPEPVKPEDIAKQLEEFKKLLERARDYDRKNHEKDCAMEAKKEALRELAKLWNIDISFIDMDKENNETVTAAGTTGSGEGSE